MAAPSKHSNRVIGGMGIVVARRPRIAVGCSSKSKSYLNTDVSRSTAESLLHIGKVRTVYGPKRVDVDHYCLRCLPSAHPFPNHVSTAFLIGNLIADTFVFRYVYSPIVPKQHESTTR